MAKRHALVLVLVLTLAAGGACTSETPTATKSTKPSSSKKPSTTKPSSDPKGSPTPEASDDAKGSPSPKGSTSPSPSGSPKPSTSPSGSATPAVAVSAPPIKFPFNKVGAKWTYALTVKLSLGEAGGDTSIEVKAADDKEASLESTFAITKAPAMFPTGGDPTKKTGKVAKTVENPFALGVLFPKDGMTVKTVVTEVKEKEKITVAAGEFETTKYTIKETTGADSADVTLWTAADGSMIKQEIKSKKPPALIELPAMAAALISGEVTTTLELKSKSGTDGTASGAASPAASTSPTPFPCPTGTPAGVVKGSAGQGAYQDKDLPAGFDEFEDEEEVTDTISDLADEADTDLAGANAWGRFKCFYTEALAIWRTKTGRTD